MPESSIIKRNSSFELLRLLLMVMIVIHHCIVHGLGLSGLTSFYNRPIVLLGNQMGYAFTLNSLCICAVNCFILISGYFSIKVSAKRFLNLLLSLIIYTILFAIIPYALEGRWKEVIKSFLFLSHSPYWFVIDYLFLMVFTPMLNLSFEKLTKYNRRLIIIGLILISCYFGFLWNHPANKNGYTILQFITMYCIGREIAISQLKIAINRSIIIYIGASILLGSLGYICWRVGNTETAWRSTYYNDPLLIISSIGLFMVFKNIRFHSKLINTLAKSSFGIYLFQSSNLIGEKMYEWLHQFGSEFGCGVFLIIITIAILTAIIAIIIDQARILILDKILPLCIINYEKIKYIIVRKSYIHL